MACDEMILKTLAPSEGRVVYRSDGRVVGYRAFASESVDLGFDSDSGQTNDFNIGIHSFPA